MKIGFTGTGNGMAPVQKMIVSRIFHELGGFTAGRVYLHHGDCVGADAQACAMAKARGWSIVAHPPIDPKARAFFASDETRPGKPYLVRDHDIVDETEILVAAPLTVEIARSGTWATVRYARRLARPIMIVYADGRLAEEGRL